MTKKVTKGITLPKEMIKKLDQIRGDISRSRYIYRAVGIIHEKGDDSGLNDRKLLNLMLIPL